MTEVEVRQALKSVHDPHVPSPLSEMGMLAEVSVSGSTVEVQLRIPCMACPATSILKDEVTAVVGALDGVQTVDVRTAWDERWNKDMLSDSAKSLMTAHGIRI